MVLPSVKDSTDNLIAAVTEDLIAHDGLYGVFGGLPGLGDDNSLPKGQTVSLDYHRDRTGLYIFQSLVHVAEYLIGRRRYIVLFHQFLGKRLAAFDDGGFLIRAESLDPGRF